MSSRAHCLTLTLVVLSSMTAAGCGSSDYWQFTPRPATGLPEQFTTDGKAGGPGCRTRLDDPRDQTWLQLFRSRTVKGRTPMQVGDYIVIPDGKYGVGARQLLRVDCDRQRALGIVDRS